MDDARLAWQVSKLSCIGGGNSLLVLVDMQCASLRPNTTYYLPYAKGYSRDSVWVRRYVCNVTVVAVPVNNYH